MTYITTWLKANEEAEEVAVVVEVTRDEETGALSARHYAVELDEEGVVQKGIELTVSED